MDLWQGIIGVRKLLQMVKQLEQNNVMIKIQMRRRVAFQNRYDFPLFCLSCVNGKCLECNKTQGYGRLDIQNNKCQSVYEDGIKSVEEYCDNGNEISYDECYQFKYSCDFNCINCQSSIYILILALVFVVMEQLLKMNHAIIENYECSSCQIYCQPECLSFQQGQSYSCENQGWEIDLIQGISNSKCGDGIIVGKEQYDDGNEIENDGCYQCEFQCQQLCTKCLSGFCIELIPQVGYYMKIIVYYIVES
ncbi:unnamed protein product [Paramecium sonneborni]|uniref:Uncharacterized protein n=1 Tax=Paramecium sonneborni TaxID=65129 RepID=A0A8S1Q2M9_9CILI|nr:unnamed protein product [Paramecium sonneborni]